MILTALFPITLALLAPEMTDYTVKGGDTCSGIAKKLYGDGERWDVIHKHNPTLGPRLPHRLKAGTVLKLPKTVAALPDAEVTSTRKRVEMRAPKHERWSDASIGQDLFKGWRVNTHEDSAAELTFRDDSQVQMRENTLVIIYGDSRTKRRTTTRASLDRGALRSRLGEMSGGEQLEVTTPSAVFDFIGGWHLIDVEDTGTSRVANHGGGTATASVPGSKRKVKIKPDFGSKVAKGRKPTKPRRLPPPPKWKADEIRRFATPANATSTVRGGWHPVSRAEKYRVEVSRAPDGTEVIANVVVPSDITKFEAQDLPPGVYWASVAAIDDDAFEGRRSATQRFEVVGVALVEPGRSRPRKLGADASLLPGTRIEDPDGVTCAVAGATDGKILASAGAHAIACESPDGAIEGFSVAVGTLSVTAAGAKGKEASARVSRGKSSDVVFAVATSAILPDRVRVEAPDGVFLSAPVRVDGAKNQWSVRVLAHEEAPDKGQLRLMADAGEAPVELGVIALAVEGKGAGPGGAGRKRKAAAADDDRPERNMVELGFFGGGMLIPTDHQLWQGDSGAEFQALSRGAGTLGLRFGYYPIRWVGAEFEQAWSPAQTEGKQRANLFGVRGHLLGQLPYRVTPTVHVGGGTFGVYSSSDALGRDFDRALHFGGGLKAYVTRWLAVRVDVRDVVGNNTAGGGLAHYLDVGVGVSGVFGRRAAGR